MTPDGYAKTRALELAAEHGEVTAFDLQMDLDLTRVHADMTLLRLFRAGRLRRPRRGVYEPVREADG